METERIWTLLSRKLANDSMDAELAELKELLAQNPEAVPIVQKITEDWKQPPAEDSEFMEATYMLHLQRMKNAGVSFFSDSDHKTTLQVPIVRFKKAKPMAFLAIAASVITFLIIYSHTTDKQPFSQSSLHTASPSAMPGKEIVSENGTRTKTILPDGSVVWLNAGSKISYQGNFSGAMREIKLEGEAYFDVAKNPARPFIVHAGSINIKVLGTAFDVKSYPADSVIETTLIRGLIQVSKQDDGNNNDAVYLHPNQKLTFVKSGKLSTLKISANQAIQPESVFSISKVDIADEKDLTETAWIYNRLKFRGDDFETLAKKLERWYNVKIYFKDDAVKKLRFNGSFENENVQQAFDALQLANPFSYRILGKEIFISTLSKTT